MTNIAQLLTEHMDIWTAAETEKKSGRGRASANGSSVYGVKKLRELILELAVRGKLVPQDNLEANKNLTFSKLGDIVEVLDNLRKPVTKQYRVKGPYPYYGASGIVDYVSNYIFDEPLVLVGEDGAKWGAGENTAFMIEGKAWVNNHAHVIRPNRKVVTDRYLTYCLVAMDLNEFITGMTVPKLNQARLISIKIPLPSLAEQHRIVAKVDELMALCDQLEQEHSNAQEVHETLVSQLLATLIQSKSAAEFNANWQRIYAHFDLLFTTETSIDVLKQTLLQLAVMGKLVPQDPNEEPASELLKRIQTEKAQLKAAGKLKREKPLAAIAEDEKPFELPQGWVWARFPQLGEFARGKSKHRPRNDPSLFNPPIYPLVQTGEVARAGYLINEYHSKYSEIGLQQSKMWRQGTLCITIAANIADTAILGFDACFPDSVVGFSPSITINNAKYFLYFMKTARADLLKFAPATAQKNINLETLESVLIPTPPLAEQHRIVAKVDALMALCDQLKTRLKQAGQQQQAIADALVAQALLPKSTEVIDFVKYRTTVACYTIKKLCFSPAFGRTQAMKVLYLAQSHVGIPMQMLFEREAAGPLDKWIYEFERLGESEQWFKVVEKSIGFGKTKFEYQIKSAIAAPASMIESVCSIEQRKELDRLLGLFAEKNTEEAEIIATLFAAWNDFLIDRKSPTDDAIVQEVRENWHERKARFSAEDLHRWLRWLRKNDLVPLGKSPRTVYQRQLIH